MIEQSTRPTIILDIPLLFESKLTYLVTEIWVVYCAYEQQIQRLMQRDKLTRQQAIVRINNQMPLEKKAKMADVVLNNSLDLPALYQQIDQEIND